jgi:hypothetical protein
MSSIIEHGFETNVSICVTSALKIDCLVADEKQPNLCSVSDSAFKAGADTHSSSQLVNGLERRTV